MQNIHTKQTADMLAERVQDVLSRAHSAPSLIQAFRHHEKELRHLVARVAAQHNRDPDMPTQETPECFNRAMHALQVFSPEADNLTYAQQAVAEPFFQIASELVEALPGSPERARILAGLYETRQTAVKAVQAAEGAAARALGR